MTERIEEMYYPLEDKLQGLFESLTEERFYIVKGDVLGEVQFKDRIFGVHAGHVSKTEDILRRLLNNKLNNAWTGQD